MDITRFFDSMSHELLDKAIERHVKEKWAKMYITRWLNAPIEDRKRNIRYRDGMGTPQGGVISPLLANLFLRYAFDKWFEKTYPGLSYVRYADDIIVHCNSQTEAEAVLSAINSRLSECRLSLNQKKTRIVYCKKYNRKDDFKTVKFDFLGFSFQPRLTSSKRSARMFLGYDCAISRKSENKITEIFRNSKFHRWTGSDIRRIADTFNPKIRGWINYYGKFRIHELMRIFRVFHLRLLKWATNRYKRFKRSTRKARRWLRNLFRLNPGLFVHWQHGFQYA